MPSTYSNLKIELIATGEQSGTWGATTNVNLGTAIEEAITGTANVAFTGVDETLTLTNTNASQTARNLRLNLTGTSGGARNLIVPAIEKFYIVNNGLADAVTIKNSSGTGVAVASGKTSLVFNDGTNVVEVVSYLNSLTTPSATITGGAISGATGSFTTLAASSTVSGAGFTAYFASPPPIGSTTPSTGAFTTLTTTGNVTLGDGSSDSITINAATASVPNNLNFSGTGSITVPNGTTGQRPGSPAAGMIRYNSTSGTFEGYTSSWGSIGGGATGGGGDQVFIENELTVTTDYTLSTNKNALSTGPITINSGVTVTIPSGQRWVIL
jgi:hypothetical protein